MKTAVRFHTRSGNTKKLAEAAAEAAGVKAEDVFVPLEEKVDLLFLGSSVYGGKPDKAVIGFISANSDKIGKIAVFGSSALKRSSKDKIKEEAEKYDITVCDEEFGCLGSFMFLHKNRPNAQDEAELRSFVKKLQNK